MKYSHKHGVTPVLMVVLDGYGIGRKTPYNAITRAKKPFLDEVAKKYPATRLQAAGEAVGLYNNVVGNSEVGHMNLGAGRIVDQDLVTINRAIEDGSFHRNVALNAALRHVKKHKGRLHLLGMISSGGVHSYLPHLFSLMRLAKLRGVKQVLIHGFTDGRDTPATSAVGYVQLIQEQIRRIGVGSIASLTGRYYAMDRVAQWDRSEALYHALVHGQPEFSETPQEYLSQNYKKGITDEYIPPVVFPPARGTMHVQKGDAVIFWHLRSDRARQLTKAFVEKRFTGFPRGEMIKNLYFVALTDFGDDLNVATAFPTYPLHNALPRVFSKTPDFTQMYVAEAEKFPHVTYFFHGSSQERLHGENIVKVPSPIVKSYVTTPTMGARAITRLIIADMNEGELRHDFILANYSNVDVLGHTGNLKQAVRAVEIIDKELARIWKVMQKKGGTMIIVADHGNAEVMYDKETREVLTSHTTNPVPCMILSTSKKLSKKNIRLEEGVLANVAPTVLELLKIKKPKEMTHKSLIIKRKSSR